MKYVSLHTHSTYSTGDGYGLPQEHVERCVSLGMNAVAFTEHGNCSSWVSLENACDSTLGAVKPIFGLEAYIGIPGERRKCHTCLLAMNSVGLANLNRIITQSWKQFYQFPTVYNRDLKRYNEGIIALSGCADSQLSCILLGGKYYGEKRNELRDGDFQRAIRGIEWYKEVFADRFYLECQRFPDLERTCILNQALEKLGATTGTPLVATSDVHYPLPDQNAMQRILHASHRGATVETADATWEYDILLTYPQSDREVFKDMVATGLSKEAAREACENTARIADRCDVRLPKAPRPKYVVGEKDWESWM